MEPEEWFFSLVEPTRKFLLYLNPSLRYAYNGTKVWMDEWMSEWIKRPAPSSRHPFHGTKTLSVIFIFITFLQNGDETTFRLYQADARTRWKVLKYPRVII